MAKSNLSEQAGLPSRAGAGLSARAGKLLIDLDISGKRKDWSVECSYFYHPKNNGGTFLREQATFAFFCRHCEDGTCVRACPKDALVRGEDGIVRRSTMLCVKCHSCVIACPFGTLMEELVPFTTSQCDLCIDRLEKEGEPLCATSCTDGSVKFGEFSEDPKNDIYALNENVLVHVSTWKKDGVRR
ncbi:MAG: 4Fe-4S dicluster domain-containing protein [bacterium]